jgi:hypothetical protein
MASVDRSLRLLRQVITGMCLGIVNARSHGIYVSSYARDRPNLSSLRVRRAPWGGGGVPPRTAPMRSTLVSAVHVPQAVYGCAVSPASQDGHAGQYCLRR